MLSYERPQFKKVFDGTYYILKMVQFEKQQNDHGGITAHMNICSHCSPWTPVGTCENLLLFFYPTIANIHIRTSPWKLRQGTDYVKIPITARNNSEDTNISNISMYTNSSYDCQRLLPMQGRMCVCVCVCVCVLVSIFQVHKHIIQSVFPVSACTANCPKCNHIRKHTCSCQWHQGHNASTCGSHYKCEVVVSTISFRVENNGFLPLTCFCRGNF